MIVHNTATWCVAV